MYFLCSIMPVYFASLNSGSNGNCYYVGNESEAILVDAGISCRETERRMRKLNLQLNRVKAIFISHEHSDHIKGLYQLARKYSLPVFISEKTLQYAGLKNDGLQFQHIQHGASIKIGSLNIKAFSKHHDAADPYSFVIEQGGTRVGVFTDIGHPCKEVIHHFSRCHAVFLEANYDDAMLQNGNYPYHLKKRISSNKGHLSNQQALELFLKYRSAKLSHLILSHLSKENNDITLVESLFKQVAATTQIAVATRFEETVLWNLPVSTRMVPGKMKPVKHSLQLNIFEQMS